MTTARVAPAGWLRSPAFDLGFIAGIAALALASGAVVVRAPELFVPVFFLDVWLLGYHHVASTFTRLAFDRASFQANRFLVTGLPPIVLLAVAGLSMGIGSWVLVSIYLYWQWFHYARQSWGIAQAYRRAAAAAPESPWLSQVVFYAVPAWGILHRSHQAPATFLDFELKFIPVSAAVVQVAAVVALAAAGWWLVGCAAAWRRGTFSAPHALFVLSHQVVFFVGYVLIDDISTGWLVVNVWHNAQYVMFVWHANNRRFAAGVDGSSPFLSTLCQPRKAWLYFATCLGLSTALYAGLQLAIPVTAALLVAHQTLNYHHYIVDAIIWRRRRRAPDAAPQLQPA
jgi:hypothetical protein